jgi:hypothetical protein
VSERVYRIKPLEWESASVRGEGIFAWFGNGLDFRGSVGYRIDHDNRSKTRPWKFGETRYRIAEDAKSACQRDYESRLIAAGVVEPVQ